MISVHRMIRNQIGLSDSLEGPVLLVVWDEGDYCKERLQLTRTILYSYSKGRGGEGQKENRGCGGGGGGWWVLCCSIVIRVKNKGCEKKVTWNEITKS